MTTLTQPPPPLPGFEPVATVHELPPQPMTSKHLRRSLAKSVEQVSVPSDDINTSLIEAVDKVYRVVTARIAYHEAEARRLREALKPFAGYPVAAPEITGDEDLLQSVLNIAKKLPLGDS